jgi:hypothetical protein
MSWYQVSIRPMGRRLAGTHAYSVVELSVSQQLSLEAPPTRVQSPHSSVLGLQEALLLIQPPPLPSINNVPSIPVVKIAVWAPYPDCRAISDPGIKPKLIESDEARRLLRTWGASCPEHLKGHAVAGLSAPIF